jgi:hypothetical protein
VNNLRGFAKISSILFLIQVVMEMVQWAMYSRPVSNQQAISSSSNSNSSSQTWMRIIKWTRKEMMNFSRITYLLIKWTLSNRRRTTALSFPCIEEHLHREIIALKQHKSNSISSIPRTPPVASCSFNMVVWWAAVMVRPSSKTLRPDSQRRNSTSSCLTSSVWMAAYRLKHRPWLV